MGWLMLGVIAAVAFAALALIGGVRGFWRMAAAALMLGAAGYAVQQNAMVPGRPVTAADRAIDVDPTMAAFRQAILPASSADQAALAAADARLRAGDAEAAVQGLIAATKRAPRDPALWTGLGSGIAAHDGGQVSPAARLAFRRGWSLAPNAPGPPFFLGLALAESGDFPAAKIAWLRALSLTPMGSPIRLELAERLALLDQIQAMADAQQRARSAASTGTAR